MKTTDIIITSRPSKASYFDADGVLQTADNNEPRFDHDPVTGEPLGLLVERGATNLLLWSEDLTNTAWSKSNITASVEGDGVCKILETEDTDFHRLSQNHAYSGTMTASFEAKSVGGRDALFQRRDAYGFTYVTVSLSTGDILDSTFPPEAKIDVLPLPDDWWRITVTSDTGNPPFGQHFHFMSVMGTTTNFKGDPACGLLLRRIQHESGPVATSYIKTEDAQATRATDNISIPLSAFPWNEAEMTAVMEFETLGLLDHISTTQNILRIGPGGNLLYQRTADQGLATDDGTNAIDLGPISVGQVVKAATSFGPGGLRGCIDGGPIASAPFDGTFGSGPNLYLGSNNGSNAHYLHIRKLKLFPRQLSDAEMMALTA